MGGESTVVLADLSSWEGWVHLAGALRRNGFEVVRVTGDHGSRLQRLRILLERTVFSRTQAVLHDGDVSPLLDWLNEAADIQMVDAIGAVLTATPQWQQVPRLHRVHAPGLDDTAAYDKWVYTQIARQHAVPVPDSRPITDEFPDGGWVVKGRVGSGGDRVAMADDADDVREALERWGISPEQAFLQRRITGQLWNVGGVASGGELLVAAAYRAFSAPGDPQGPPADVQVSDRPDMIEATRELVHALGYSGPFAIDFIDDGTPYLLDFNPRFFGTWAALQASGVDLLGAYLSTLGRPWKPVHSTVDTGVVPSSVTGVSGVSAAWRRAREFTGRTADIIGPSASLAVTAQALSQSRVPRDRPAVTLAYSEPWLAGLQFAAALRQRGIGVRRCTVSPHTALQRARLTAEGMCFDDTELVLYDDEEDLVVLRPDILIDGVVDVQMTERVLDSMLDTGQWRDAWDLHSVPAAVDQRLLCDKAALHQWAEDHSVPVPRVWTDGEVPDRWPVIAKPVTGYGGVGVCLCRDADVLAHAQRRRSVIVQEALPGPQVNIGGVARAGEILLTVAYQPMPARNHPNGPPVAIEVIDSPEADHIAATLMDSLKYSGPFCLDLMRDAEGHLALVDLNARIFGAWTGLQRAGADILGAYLHGLDLAGEPRPARIRAGEQITVDIDPAESAWASWRRLSDDMRSLTGYRGLIGQAALAMAKKAHGARRD